MLEQGVETEGLDVVEMVGLYEIVDLLLDLLLIVWLGL